MILKKLRESIIFLMIIKSKIKKDKFLKEQKKLELKLRDNLKRKIERKKYVNNV